MKRRDFLKFSGALVAQSFVASAMLDSVFISSAFGDEVPLKDLVKNMPEQDGLVLVAENKDFAALNNAFNRRTMKTPVVRVMCATNYAVQIAIHWARVNNVPLAIRSGGHSFEGFSQGTGLIIDTRPMDKLSLAQDANSFTTGAGIKLGRVYSELSKAGRSVPAGTCPTVGITGHTLGGGYGMLARPFGLACDSLIAAEVVTADGIIRTASASENPDLLWALKGGGAGSLGIVTRLQFRTHKVKSVLTYGFGYKLKPATAAKFMKTWQQWAPNAPREINSLMKISRVNEELIGVRFVGQTIGDETQLKKELRVFTNMIQPQTMTIKNLAYIDSIKHFGGAGDLLTSESEPIYMKGKSDYLKKVMSDEGLSVFLRNIPTGIDVLFDAYGGTISDVKENATAFPNRAGTVCSLQYYTQWSQAASGPQKMATMKTFHDKMRPYMSGAAYFNYCDLEIKNYAQAYWGSNLDTLISIKNKYDPQDFFKHAQSIPTRR